MAFRSGLEEKVADLMVELGVKYEYESIFNVGRDHALENRSVLL